MLGVFFEKEKYQGKATLRSRVIDRTAEATGVGRATVIRIKREMNEKEKFESPEKRYRKSRVLINVEDFDCGVIRKTVKEFYENKTYMYPTLDKLLTKLKEKMYLREEEVHLQEF